MKSPNGVKNTVVRHPRDPYKRLAYHIFLSAIRDIRKADAYLASSKPKKPKTVADHMAKKKQALMFLKFGRNGPAPLIIHEALGMEWLAELPIEEIHWKVTKNRIPKFKKEGLL